MTDLVIVGDEAWVPEEWEREQRRRTRTREYNREYRKRPGYAEKKREYNRRWMARKRARGPHPVGFLHSLACPSPHRRPRKHCTPIPVFSKNVEQAA